MRTVILALNTSSTISDRAILQLAGFRPKLLTGVYMHLNGTTTNEASYRVEVETEQDLTRLKEIAAEHGQESILIIDGELKSTLFFINTSETTDLGVYTNCTRDEALSESAYTLDPQSGEYFICVS